MKFKRIMIALVILGVCLCSVAAYLQLLPMDLILTKPDANLAFRLYNEGKMSEAKRVYESLLKSGGESLDILNNLCAVHFVLGEFAEAKQVCKKVLDMNGNVYNAHFNLGLIAEAEQDDLTAMAKFEKVLALKPEHAISWFHLGNIHQRQGKCEQAVKMYDKAITQAGSDLSILPDVFYNQGLAFVACHDLIKGRASYERALQYPAKNRADIYYNLGNLFREENNTAKAIECYLSAIRENNDYFDAYNNLGVTYADSGDVQKAIEICEKALKRGRYFEIFYNVGLNYHHIGDNEHSYQRLEEAHKMQPENIAVLLSLAHVTTSLELYDESRKHYLSVLEQDPDNEMAQEHLKELLEKNSSEEVVAKPMISQCAGLPHHDESQPTREQSHEHE